MQPIFKEQINMWKDFGFDIPIIEGTYWLDNGIIKAFTPDGELHKLYKYKVLDDLSISITEHKDFKDTIKPCFYWLIYALQTPYLSHLSDLIFQFLQNWLKSPKMPFLNGLPMRFVGSK